MKNIKVAAMLGLMAPQNGGNHTLDVRSLAVAVAAVGGHELTIGQMSDILQLPPSTAARWIDAAAEDGLVERFKGQPTRDPTHTFQPMVSRETFVRITPKGLLRLSKFRQALTPPANTPA